MKNKSRNQTVGVLTTTLFAIAATHANADVVSFQNPPGPGHFDWAPSSGEIIGLDITLSAADQTGVTQGATTFEHTNSDTFSFVDGTSDGREVRAGGIHGGLLWASVFGDPIPAQAPLPSNHNWNPSSLIIHPALGSNFAEGEEAYLGVRFDTDGGGDNWHYGWIGVVRTGIEFDAFAWGYETEPGVPIAAGVPEPTTLVLFAVAGSLFIRRRRRFE